MVLVFFVLAVLSGCRCLWALGVCKVLWRAVWPTVWFSLGIKKGGSIEPPIVGRFCPAVGQRANRRSRSDSLWFLKGS